MILLSLLLETGYQLNMSTNDKFKLWGTIIIKHSSAIEQVYGISDPVLKRVSFTIHNVIRRKVYYRHHDATFNNHRLYSAIDRRLPGLLLD